MPSIVNQVTRQDLQEHVKKKTAEVFFGCCFKTGNEKKKDRDWVIRKADNLLTVLYNAHKVSLWNKNVSEKVT